MCLSANRRCFGDVENFSTSPKDRWCTSGTLMILSPYSTMKKTATISSSSSTLSIPHFASPIKRNLITLSLFLTDFITSVYRKPTFTGQYLRWNSFSPQKRKINLIGTLVHRAFMICSKSKLDQELGKIRSILLENGYPERIINSAFKRKLQQINSNPVHTVKKCPVYLHIPWIGSVSMKFEKQITSAVKRCFFSVEPRVIFNTRQLLPAIKKDVLPSHHHSNVIYQFLCHCDSRYVGRTSQRLEERIKQHVPKSITNPRTSANRQSLSRSCKNNIRPQQFHESAIGQHLLDNAQCALHYSNEKFSILARGRSSFHLSALEATFIKSLNPFLCKQKEFVYSLKIS